MTAEVPAAVLASVRSTSDRPIPHPRQEPTMTAPHPSPAGLSPLLDQLDEAWAKGTPGPWRQDLEHPRYIEAPDQDDLAEALDPADAALIVAAVNALPQLTAAIRAVAAEAERMAYPANEPWGHVTQAEHGERLLRILTAALTPGADTAAAAQPGDGRTGA